MPRKGQGWITFQTSEEERQLLEEVCRLSQRTKTEVLREMLRELKYPVSAYPEDSAAVQPTQDKKPVESHAPKTMIQQQPQACIPADTLHLPRPLKVSSRNILAGKVRRVIKGPVSTEVTLEIVHRVELTSTITTTSAETLDLAEGKTAYAVIKSSDVVIAMD